MNPYYQIMFNIYRSLAIPTFTVLGHNVSTIMQYKNLFISVLSFFLLKRGPR